MPLFPDWMQQLIAILPFRGLIDTPFRIYLGSLSGAVTAVAHQLVWIVALVFIGCAVLTRRIRLLVVQGG